MYKTNNKPPGIISTCNYEGLKTWIKKQKL